MNKVINEFKLINNDYYELHIKNSKNEGIILFDKIDFHLISKYHCHISEGYARTSFGIKWKNDRPYK